MEILTQKMSSILGLLKRLPLSVAAPLPIPFNQMFEVLFSALIWIAQLIK